MKKMESTKCSPCAGHDLETRKDLERVFVMGDIHGCYKALLQCLERSNFDKENDTLIQLGDVVDRFPHSKECVDELLTIKNLITIKGNHDEWLNLYINKGIHGSNWTQGAQTTLGSYMDDEGIVNIPDSHRKFFNEQLNYFIDNKNRLFVHGGFNRHFPINQQNVNYIYYWDRDLWYTALSMDQIDEHNFKTKDNFDEIFIGHTSTINWGTVEPMKACNIWNLDTGGGFNGKLTIMNVDTKEYFQSDLVEELYKDFYNE